MRVLITIFVLAFSLAQIFAQNVVHRNDTIQVEESGRTLKFPWAGGINSGQLSTIDLNFDGLQDIVLLEASGEPVIGAGDKYITFINNGTSGQVDYSYAPEYETQLPLTTQFGLFRDYNCDGKKDLFAFNRSERHHRVSQRLGHQSEIYQGKKCVDRDRPGIASGLWFSSGDLLEF